MVFLGLGKLAPIVVDAAVISQVVQLAVATVHLHGPLRLGLFKAVEAVGGGDEILHLLNELLGLLGTVLVRVVLGPPSGLEGDLVLSIIKLRLGLVQVRQRDLSGTVVRTGLAQEVILSVVVDRTAGCDSVTQHFLVG